MMCTQLLIALGFSVALAEPNGLRGEDCCKNCPREPFCSTETNKCHWGKGDPNVHYLECNTAPEDVPEGYVRRSLVEHEGKPLKDYYRVDLATCARLCNKLPNCNSFSYTSQDHGKCHLKSKVVSASDAAVAKDHQGFRTYYKQPLSERAEENQAPQEKTVPETLKPEGGKPQSEQEQPKPEGETEPETPKPEEEKSEQETPSGYIKRGLVEDEGNKTLAYARSVDLKTCALFCDTLPTCNSFAFTPQFGGSCHLLEKVVTTSEKSAQADEGYHTYYKEKKEEEEVPSADPSQVYHDLDGASSTWQNFIVCHGARVCRGGWYRGVCRGGFYCRGYR